MTKVEVIGLLTQMRLMKVFIDGRETRYVDGNEVFYDGEYHRRTNVYGVYRNPESRKYVFFVTGNEHGGMMVHHRNYDTEDGAYTALYHYVDRKAEIASKQ